jgi:HCO3- transporter family.
MTNFNQRTVAVSLLMFITVIAPTLTFGAVYGSNTEFHIGAVETILATAWMGVFFSFFSGMPMVSSKKTYHDEKQILRRWMLCIVNKFQF